MKAAPRCVALKLLPSQILLAIALALPTAAPSAYGASAPIVQANGDAFVAHQNGSDTWYIGSTNLELAVGLNSSRMLVPQRLLNPTTERTWNLAAEPDVTITLGDERITLGSAGPLTLNSTAASSTDTGVKLDFVFEHREKRLRITRSYAAYPGSPTIETWTMVENLGTGSIQARELMGWQLTMPLGRVRWLGGLRGDSADNIEAGAFALDEWDLDAGDRLEIGSERRSTEQFIPFFIVDDGRDVFYGGIMWSAGWRLAFERRADTLHVSSLFPGVGTGVSSTEPLEVPHTFFGLTSRSIADESGALHQFIINGIRKGRPFFPLVTYNTWFPFGVTVTEDLMVAEMDRAASLGVEMFVLDAGWWIGAGQDSDFDFDSGLGSWAEDRDRFPASLASLRDYAHGLGMQFGLWVEPGRVALSTVDKPGNAREAWLAQQGKVYGSANTAQVCLAADAARQWVAGRLVDLITRVRPDYLKWDENFWINCNRDGHGHGVDDGAFRHTKALYGIMADLRRQFPNLIIENVSGGGNRMDFGMIAYTDVGWMDDRTAPSTHVRHNLEGLTFAFPPAYLLSFVIDGEGEPMAAGYDLDLFVRSRMPGALGLAYRSDRVDETTASLLMHQIQQYKRLRDIIADANATLLSAQAPVADGTWDVMQEVQTGGGAAVIFAYKDNDEDGRVLVRPRGLIADATYDVESLDAGPIGSAQGSVLMQDGLEIVHSGTSRGHVLILTAR